MKRTIRWRGSPTISSPEMTGCESTLNTCAICSPDGWNETACTVMNPKPKPITEPNHFCSFCRVTSDYFPKTKKQTPCYKTQPNTSATGSKAFPNGLTGSATGFTDIILARAQSGETTAMTPKLPSTSALSTLPLPHTE